MGCEHDHGICRSISRAAQPAIPARNDGLSLRARMCFAISFSDGVALSIQRFDDRWISATGGGVSYEFDRGSSNLTFAGTIMKAGTATIIIGAGRCTVASDAT
jgi:hypothetical protein